MGSPSIYSNRDRCLRGKLHLATAMRLFIIVGICVLLALSALLFVKFRKAMFILLIPLSVVGVTIAAVTTRNHRLVWPIIAQSCFHIGLSTYALLIFSFYFFIKPLYILMITNWMFKTMYSEKNAVFYGESATVYAFLFTFLFYNLWQARVSFAYRNYLLREANFASSIQKPTVVVVNKPIEYASSHY
ncbi:unnamed protein product, partial [Mesorhabditis belari]|uniref:Uncharacterized protein n=1 Tax=Mesorhabditis belari TaxID=2138241 RepID=A0AAF3ED56_9BILA